MPTAAPEKAKSPFGPLRHLPYYAPYNIYIPTVLIFALLHYSTFATTADPAHPRQLLPPPYLQRLEARYGPSRSDSYASPPPPVLGSLLYLVADFFERTVVQHYYTLGDIIFGASNVIWVVIGAWFVHLFELGMCVRICLACRAKPWHTFLYMVATATGGFAQLGPLMKAREAYMKSQRGEADPEEEDGKKKK